MARANVAQRAVWTVLVAGLLALAAGGPVQILRAQADKADKDAAEQPAPAGEEPPETAGSATVSMVAISFRPATLTVRRGTEVVFENDDVAPHTVTAAGGGPVDSGTLGPGKVYRLVINEPLEYLCLIHPSMKGKIVFTG